MNPRLNFNQCLVYLAFVCAMTVLAILSMRLGDGATELLLKEGGIVESASAIGYFLCIAILCFFAGARSLLALWYIHVLLLAMALRELDFDKRFTETGVLKSKFLLADNVGLTAKVLGATVLLVVLVAVVTWVARHAKSFFSGVLNLRSGDWAMGFALAFILLTKSIDGLARKLEPLGFAVTQNANELASRFEEIFELGIPITFLYAMYLYWQASTEA